MRCCRLFLTLSAILAGTLPILAADWIHWRGPEQNGFSRETQLPDTWKPTEAGKNNLIWKQPFNCRSTPLILNGKVYLINDAGKEIAEQERVMCLDAATGQVEWEYKFNVWFTDIVSNRVGWTNLTADPATGRIYAHGTQGLLLCLDGKTGNLLWQRSLAEEFGRISGYGGRLCSPIFDSGLLIVGMLNSSWGDQGRGWNRYFAFDGTNGQVVWSCDMPARFNGTYYSNPVIAVINGQRQLVTGASDGAVHGIQVRTGKLAWSYYFCASVVNSSPIVDGNLVYCTHGEENTDSSARGRVICVDASQLKPSKAPGGAAIMEPKLIWESKEGPLAGYTSPLLAESKLYVADDKAKMFCYDAKTGAVIFRRAGYGTLSRGSPVFADGKIYVSEVNAKFWILQPTSKGLKELSETRFRVKPGESGLVECNGTPAVSNGRIYFGNRDDFFCIGKPDWKPNVITVPELPAEKPANGKPTTLLVYPSEVTIHPGESVTFKAKLYDENGQFLREEAKVEWSLPVPPVPPPPPGLPPETPMPQPPALKGDLDPSGQFTAHAPPKAPPAQQGYVQAKVGDLTARARVRIAPKLPYQPKLENLPVLAPIGGAVNLQGKFVIAEVERAGQKIKALKKLAVMPNPPLRKANAYLTKPDTTGYTIQADIMARKFRDVMPDVGVVANRYTLQLGGNAQDARILSWEALPRVDKGMPFKFQADTWYTLKLTVDVGEKQAEVKGKVWEADQPEPKDWTITFTDPVPNREGSAALFADAVNVFEKEGGPETFFTNIRVTPNTK